MSKLYVLGHLGTDRLWANGKLVSDFFGGSIMHFVNGLSFTNIQCSILSSCNLPRWTQVLDVWSSIGHVIDQVRYAELDAVFDCYYDADLQFIPSLFAVANVPDIDLTVSQSKIEAHSHLHFGTLPIQQLESIFSHLKCIDGLVFSAQTHMSLIEHSEDIEIFSKVANQLKVLFLNLEEAAILARLGKHQESEIVEYYSNLGPIVFITDSHRALVVSDQYSSGWVEAPHVGVVDPTGAGDTFAGVALGMLLGGSHAATALSAAMAIASLSTTGVLASSLFSIHRDAHRNRYLRQSTQRYGQL